MPRVSLLASPSLVACGRLRRGGDGSDRTARRRRSRTRHAAQPAAARERSSSGHGRRLRRDRGSRRSGRPGQAEPDAGRARDPARTLGRRRPRPRPPPLPRRLPAPAAATTPLTDDGAERVRRVRGAIAARAAGGPRLHRRQRAEPQPLLAAAVRGRAARTAAPATTRRCSPETLRRAQGRLARRQRHRRGARPARQRPTRTGRGTRTRRPRSSATSGAALPRERPRASRSWTCFAIHPYLETLEHAAGRPRTRTAHDASGSPTTTSSSALLDEAFDGTAQEGGDLPIALHASSASRRRSRRRSRRSTRAASSPLGEARRRGRRRPTTTAKRSSSRPARRPCRLLIFHLNDEPDLAGWQSGVYYVDGTPKSSLPAVREAVEAARHGRASTADD